MIYRHSDDICTLTARLHVSCVVEEDQMKEISVKFEDGNVLNLTESMFFALLGPDAYEFQEDAMKLAQNVKYGSGQD